MGLNAQTAVPVFTAGQVLTAQQQTEINTGIPVFATTVTRDAAFGGANEKTLAEGQFAYIEATNALQYYDGAAWQASGTTPGLVCVKAETAFSAVTSVTADSVFTSTYTNYLVKIIYQTSSTQSALMKFRAGGVATSTNYNRQRLLFNASTVSTDQLNAQTSLDLGGTNGAFDQSFDINLYNVQVATPTNVFVLNQNNFANYTTGNAGVILSANQSASTAFDGIEWTVATGTFTGKYAIYGYSKTV